MSEVAKSQEMPSMVVAEWLCDALAKLFGGKNAKVDVLIERGDRTDLMSRGRLDDLNRTHSGISVMLRGGRLKMPETSVDFQATCGNLKASKCSEFLRSPQIS